jgi:hypothetical protein
MTTNYETQTGDVFTLVAMSWHEKQWEFDNPSMLLFPVTKYYNDSRHPEIICDDAAIEALYGNIECEDVSEECEFYGWNLKTLRKVARNRMAGKNHLWKSKNVTVVRMDVEMCGNEYKVISKQEF